MFHKYTSGTGRFGQMNSIINGEQSNRGPTKSMKLIARGSANDDNGNSSCVYEFGKFFVILIEHTSNVQQGT